MSDKVDKESKQLDSAKDSERMLLTPSKSDLAESEDLHSCDDYWPVCIHWPSSASLRTVNLKSYLTLRN